MKRLLLFAALATTISMACTSCEPAKLQTEDVIIPEEPWAFATWEDCSQVVGDHPCNFTLLDQDNKEVSLYDFYGSTIILDLSAMWCSPCQAAGSDVQDTIERFASEDIRYVTVLIENLQGNPLTQDDVQSWALNLGIETEPILQGSRDFLNSDATIGWPLESWPTFILITSEMKIHTFQKGYSQQILDMLIEDTISQTK
jgi:thiol-disulfide isomerase/thioredoxin